MLLRGLPELDPEEIITELSQAKLKLQKLFPIRREPGSTRRDQLYLVHLEKGSATMADVTKVRHLFQMVVVLEKYRPKKKEVT